jgi:hypothetical protein
MAQQQQGFGQVNVIINVAMGVFLAPPFSFSSAPPPRPNDYLNRNPAFCFVLFFVSLQFSLFAG